MSIVNLIVHEVQKPVNESKAMLVARPNENPIDDDALSLAAQVTNLFNRSGMNTGRFSNEEGSDEGAKLPALLHRHFDGSSFDDFSAFTKAVATDFVRHIESVEETEGGLLWFNHYEVEGTHFLFIVLLKRKQGLTLGSDLTFAQVEQLETEKLHMAMRVNLSAYHDRDESRYIAFRFGRAPKQESEYFTKFIGCNEPKVAAKETRQLVEAAAAFCQAASLPTKEANEFRKSVSEQCMERAEERQPIEIKEIAKQIENRFSPEQASQFLEIAESDAFNIEKEVFVEKAALKKLTRVSGSNRTMTLSFDADLIGQSVEFDEQTGSLTIKDLPRSLLKQLQKL
ncbi:nucleoid-associated protein [Marinomonas balearica]|uniref:Nucleoid-associated protein n=1 Tax=Marinomonas balearica TaxID=491947 RepID=A0A4R6MET2_9GAMM|nr:nucleoid-associated protein [Marinomonas balearica]TDO99775.1 nucleoid-associated protein [Marinomonas balearica]